MEQNESGGFWEVTCQNETWMAFMDSPWSVNAASLKSFI